LQIEKTPAPAPRPSGSSAVKTSAGSKRGSATQSSKPARATVNEQATPLPLSTSADLLLFGEVKQPVSATTGSAERKRDDSWQFEREKRERARERAKAMEAKRQEQSALASTAADAAPRKASRSDHTNKMVARERGDAAMEALRRSRSSSTQRLSMSGKKGHSLIEEAPAASNRRASGSTRTKQAPVDLPSEPVAKGNYCVAKLEHQM